MKKIGLVLLVVVCVAGCEAAQPEVASTPTATAAPAPPATLTHRCADGYRFHVLVRSEEARLMLPEGTVVAAAVPAASGARYEGPAVVYWSKGEEAMLEVGDAAHRGCRITDRSSSWARAALEGVAFRAVGQEPGWVADLYGDGRIRVEADYGERRLAFPASTIAPEDGAVVVRADHEGHSLAMRILQSSCTDAMSGFRFPAMVEVELDGEGLNGCGRPLEESFFEAAG